ncbi:hypothetical protein F8G81_22060 [Arthrobacter sp. CDRTa11]|nr:hypothetical protein F8G81_22060 [Arthrobacter sp. CDRTa11]
MNDAGASLAGDSSVGSALPPAVEPAVEPAVAPGIRPAAPVEVPVTGTATKAPTGQAPTGETAPLPASTQEPAPDVPWIPPLWAPDAELASPTAPATAPAAPPVPGAESATTPPGAEALVPDNNAAAILTVFNRINEYRASRGLAPVKYHATVAGMAQEWSDSIASREVIEHRASFWTDPRALNPNNGAGEVIAIRTDRDAAMLVEWWKGSPGHNAMLLDPRFNVMGAGITYTDRTYKIWGVVNFFGYTTLPAGTTNSPGGAPAQPTLPPTVCDPAVKHMPPTLDLASAAINSPADLISINSSGQLLNRPAAGNRAFGAAKVIGSGFGTAKEVFITDWERDGTYDLLTQWQDGRLTLHAGVAGGGFQAPVTLGQSGWAPLTLAVGGWCANNRLPQVLALDAEGNLFLYPNRGLADMAARTLIASGVVARRLAMVDYDADGFQDLLALRTDGAVQLYRGGGIPTPKAEGRPTVATGWQDVTGMRPLKDATGLNSTGVALRRANDVVQYWDLSTGSLAAPSNITGSWTGQRLAQ